MAGYTSRLILILAIPSFFGFLGILLLRKKNSKFHFSEDIEIKEKVSSRHIHQYQTLTSMKLKSQESCSIKESEVSKEMQLKENEASADEQTTSCNGMSIPLQQFQENGVITDNQIHVANGISQQNRKNMKLREIESAAACGEMSNGAGSLLLNQQIKETEKSSEQFASSNGNDGVNGVKPKKIHFISNDTTKPQEISENQLNRSHNGLGEGTSNSNGISTNGRSKSRKKSKAKLRENGNSCAKETDINGCEKDNTAHVIKDSRSELSNGIETLCINDEVLAQQKQTVHITKSSEMDARCPVQTFIAETVTKNSFQLNTSTVLGENLNASGYENGFHIQAFEAAKDTCDTVSQIHLDDSLCVTPESGRLSESSSESLDNIQIDINQPLTIPVEFIPPSSQDSMLQSPEAAYCDSLGSNDSGRGASEIHFEQQPNSMVYEFEISSEHCGFLIGKKGNHVNLIRDKTNACIWIRNYPFEKEKKIVSVGGECQEIEAALKLIRRRFPLKDYPKLTLEQINCPGKQILCPSSLKLALPEGVEFQVILSATMHAGHFFIQLPTHPSFHALPPFTMSMSSLYAHCPSPIVEDLAIGNVVAAPVSNGWFRAEIVEIFEEETCKLKYLDYGGYQIVPSASLRQINIDYMQMPFQAIECYLANVICADECNWTEESKRAFEELAQGQILSAYVAGIAEDGVPCLCLYKVTGATNTFINQALVEAGFLKWITYDQ